MKNILIVQGGGRPKGNTAQLVEHFIKGAEEAGHKTELVSLLKNEVKGCLGCNACQYGKPCTQKDSFNEIIPKIMLMYGKEASNRKQEIDRQHHTIPNQRNQRPKDKHRGNVYNLLFRHGKVRSQNMEKLKCSFPTTP